jgi:glycosyltransferase involved in cell wall biosynthesis
MRILVYDPEHISHSTDVVRRGLLPELANRVERLVWMLPESRHEAYRDLLTGQPAIELAGFELQRIHPVRWLDAVLRRLQNNFCTGQSGFLQWLRGRLQAHVASRKAREIGADWIFCPSFMRQPVPKGSIPLAGMIYDMGPNLSEFAFTNTIERFVERAEVIVAISEYTRGQLLDLIPSAVDRVHVIPLSPTPILQTEDSHLDRMKDCFRFLCPASLTPRKGQADLLNAARLLNASVVDFELVFCGGGTDTMLGDRPDKCACYPQSLEACRLLISDGGKVKALGHVSQAELEQLYLQADAVVFPTHYEGFGLPVSEAVQRGLPVIASDLPPIREQLVLFNLDDRVRLVSPGDVKSLANALDDYVRGRGPGKVSPNSMEMKFNRWTWSDIAKRIVYHMVTPQRTK